MDAKVASLNLLIGSTADDDGSGSRGWQGRSKDFSRLGKYDSGKLRVLPSCGVYRRIYG
jgi:hypothetical protein